MNTGNIFTMRRRAFLGGMAALGTATVLGFDPKAARAAGSDGTLIFGLSSVVGSLVYGPSRGAAQYVVCQQLHRGLVKFDLDGSVVPALAESVEAIDPSTYSFTLRDGLTFHDGSPIDAAVVKASYDYLANPDTGSAIYSALSSLESIETPDEKTVIFHLGKPNASFLEYLAHPNAYVSPAAALEANAPNWIGAGPFKLVDSDTGVGLNMVRAETYYDQAEVALDGMNFIFYKDSSARTNALISGDVDMIDFVGWEDFERIEDESDLVLDGLTISGAGGHRYAVLPHDGASARARFEGSQTFTRDDWSVRMDASSEVYWKDGKMVLKSAYDAYEGDEKVFSKRWTHRFEY